MAYLKFPSILKIKTADTSEIVNLGKYKVNQNEEIAYARPGIYVHGTPGGSETLQLRIHTGDDLTAVYASSNTVSLSGFTTDYNLGVIRFDFNRQNINKNLFYTHSIVINNYTRNADTFYIGFIMDFPDVNKIYSSVSNPTDGEPAALQLFGYK